MNKYFVSASLLVLFALVSLTGCGNGGDSGTTPATPAVQATKAVLTLSVRGTVPPTTQIGAIEVVVNLPPGVTAKAVPSPTNPSVMVADTGVVTVTGGATGSEVIIATYSTTPAPAFALDLTIAKSGGFAVGDIAIVSCDIASGVHPAAGDFSLSNFKAVDLNGVQLTGLTAGFSVVMQ